MPTANGGKKPGGISALNKALLDTDTLSGIGKGINLPVAGNATTYRRAFGRYTTSVVRIMEIIRGFPRATSTQRLQTIVASITVLELLPFDQAAAELAGRIAGDLERVGRPIGVADPMIAAIALTHGLELVTSNTTHFHYVQNLGYPLTLVNWRQRSEESTPAAENRCQFRMASGIPFLLTG